MDGHNPSRHRQTGKPQRKDDRPRPARRRRLRRGASGSASFLSDGFRPRLQGDLIPGRARTHRRHGQQRHSGRLAFGSARRRRREGRPENIAAHRRLYPQGRRNGLVRAKSGRTAAGDRKKSHPRHRRSGDVFPHQQGRFDQGDGAPHRQHQIRRGGEPDLGSAARFVRRRSASVPVPRNPGIAPAHNDRGAAVAGGQAAAGPGAVFGALAARIDAQRDELRAGQYRAATEIELKTAYSFAARCGRQRLVLSSRSRTSPVMMSDRPANMIRPANTISTLKLLAARTMTTPRPSCAPKNSATTTPRIARPIASRTPTTMNGKELGRITSRATSHSLAPKDRTTLMRTLSALRTPSWVLIRSGNTAPRNTIAIFDHMPMPSQSISNGRKTNRGVALKAVTNGSSIAFIVFDRPSRMPSGRPAASAKARPIAKAAALTPSGAQIEPVANISQSVAKMRLGTVKNSLVPALIGRKCGANSQMSNKSTMAAVPSAIDSMRCRDAVPGKVPEVAPSSRSSVCISAIDYCPKRHGKAVRSAQRMPSVNAIAMTMTVRMQANMRSTAKMSANRVIA